MTGKQLQVRFSNGEVYAIPLSEIADRRATSYEQRATEEWDAMFSETMECPDEAIDWARNNEDWKDVEQFALRVEQPELVDYEDEWCNAEMKVVEAEDA
jgi:hypothetical protein